MVISIAGSLDNTGCLSKVMKDVSDEQLSDNEWAHFIEEYVKKIWRH